MALTAPQTDQAWTDLVRSDSGAAAFTKTELRAVVAAVDTWATANAASYNTALPTGFRTNASNAQKAFVLAYVCLRRAGI